MEVVAPELLLEVAVPELLEVVAPELLVELEDPPQGPQTPSALPMGTMHEVPPQQSALLVHLPQAGTHVPVWRQT